MKIPSTVASITTCRWCGLTSSTIPHTIESCPLVKAVEYHPDGSLSRVEKFGPQDATIAPVTPLWWYSSHYTTPTAVGEPWPGDDAASFVDGTDGQAHKVTPT
jgi:hypothetical protein